MIFPVLIVIVLAVAFLSLATGSAPVAVLPGLSDWLLGINSPAAMVIGDIRLPRTLLSLTVGASLGLSGAALQGLLRNPLADPSLTGASQGAALGAAPAVVPFRGRRREAPSDRVRRPPGAGQRPR